MSDDDLGMNLPLITEKNREKYGESEPESSCNSLPPAPSIDFLT